MFTIKVLYFLTLFIAYHRKDAIKNLGVSWNSGDHVATLYGEEILSLNVLHYGSKDS